MKFEMCVLHEVALDVTNKRDVFNYVTLYYEEVWDGVAVLNYDVDSYFISGNSAFVDVYVEVKAKSKKEAEIVFGDRIAMAEKRVYKLKSYAIKSIARMDCNG